MNKKNIFLKINRHNLCLLRSQNLTMLTLLCSTLQFCVFSLDEWPQTFLA